MADGGFLHFEGLLAESAAVLISLMLNQQVIFRRMANFDPLHTGGDHRAGAQDQKYGKAC